MYNILHTSFTVVNILLCIILYIEVNGGRRQGRLSKGDQGTVLWYPLVSLKKQFHAPFLSAIYCYFTIKNPWIDDKDADDRIGFPDVLMGLMKIKNLDISGENVDIVLENCEYYEKW